MDPNATLAHLRAAVKTVEARRGQEDIETNTGLVAMVESFSALDDWLSRGGFLPTEWEQHR